jgi:sensor histidine kinase YesM
MRASHPTPALLFTLVHFGYGMVLGAAVSTLNFAYHLPLVATTDHFDFLSFVSLMPEWCGEGMLLALIVGLIMRWTWPRELRAWELSLAIVFAVVVSVLTWQVFTLLVLREWVGIRLLRDYMGMPVVWISGVFYHGWMMLFFSGLAAAVYSSRRRRERMLDSLLKAELSRASSQQRYAQARLDLLQTQIEPDYLLQTLTQLEHAYETNVDKADQLLDELIAYLRQSLVKIRESSDQAASFIHTRSQP